MKNLREKYINLASLPLNKISKAELRDVFIVEFNLILKINEIKIVLEEIA